MEQYFFIICILSFAIVLFISLRMLRFVSRETALYRLFAKNEDLRALMAKDPRRFHISIVYLMTYMTRSDGNAVQGDKLRMIVRYIREICPQKYQDDAINGLDFLTRREKGFGKTRKTETIVDVDAFKKGNDSCVFHGDPSFHYVHDLHGTKLAEELGLYLSEDDRLYVMYLLFQMAAIDGTITTEGNKSESKLIYNLCVKGLKIAKQNFTALLNAYKESRQVVWYDSHFPVENGSYPSHGQLKDIFQSDNYSFAGNNKRVKETSVLNSIKSWIGYSGIVQLIVVMLFFSYVVDLMCDVYPIWFIFTGGIATLLLLLSYLFFSPIESSLLPVLRTKIEDKLQLRGLVAAAAMTLVLLVSLFYGVANMLLLLGNEWFSCDQPYVVNTRVTSTYAHRSKNSTTYYAKFPSVSVADADLSSMNRKKVSAPNALGLKAVYMLSGMKFRDVKNTRTLDEVKIKSSEYNWAEGKDIILCFKQGYYGLLFYDSYRLLK